MAQTVTTAVEDYGIGSPRAKAMLVGTAKDILKRINQNFKRLGISPYDNRHKGTGELLRSIHWSVFNATNGDEAVIQFYLQNVSSFVELAVQGMQDPKSGKYMKGWKVENGGLPGSIPSANYGGIIVNRRNTSGGVLRRKAKPFAGGEMRLHGRMLFDRLTKDYGYIGNVLLLSSVVPTTVTNRFITDTQRDQMTVDEVRLVMKHIGWSLTDKGKFTLE